MNSSFPVEGVAHGCGVVEKSIVAAPTPFPFPYSTDFSSSRVRFNDFPEFLSDVQGVFRVGEAPSPEKGNVLWQTVGSSHYTPEHAQQVTPMI